MNNSVSDLLRQAELNLRNEERLAEWRRRYQAATGRKPAAADSLYAAAIRRALRDRQPKPAPHPTPGFLLRSETARGNATVVKMPRRKRQYMHVDWPSGPEAA